MISKSKIYVAHFVIELTGTMAIGSGKEGLDSDQEILTNHLGLPYIPGTSIMGSLANSLSNSKSINEEHLNLFNGGESKGSNLIVSSAHVVNQTGEVLEGLMPVPNNEYIDFLVTKKVVRDHVRINTMGSAEKMGKFDQQAVPKGVRFAFRLELELNDNDLNSFDEQQWNILLEAFSHSDITFGSGETKGKGQFKIIECKHFSFDLTNSKGIQKYQTYSSSLNSSTEHWTNFESKHNFEANSKNYNLKLKPEGFILFGEGAGDEEADAIHKKEACILWTNDNTPVINNEDQYYLIPASSIKGALRHRTLYHYTKLNHNKDFISINIDKEEIQNNLFKHIDSVIESTETKLLKAIDNEDIDEIHKLSKILERLNNELSGRDVEQTVDAKIKFAKDNHDIELFDNISQLFGKANNGNKKGLKSSIVVQDVFIKPNKATEHLQQHVSIDRFTSGAKNGALFNEKAILLKEPIEINITVKNANNIMDNDLMKALSKSIQDLQNGMLPLGGMTSKGYGYFKTINS